MDSKLQISLNSSRDPLSRSTVLPIKVRFVFECANLNQMDGWMDKWMGAELALGYNNARSTKMPAFKLTHHGCSHFLARSIISHFDWLAHSRAR